MCALFGARFASQTHTLTPIALYIKVNVICRDHQAHSQFRLTSTLLFHHKLLSLFLCYMHIISPIYQIFSCVARLVFPQFNARYVFRDCSSYCPWTYWFISCVISSSHFINSPHLDSLFVVHAAMCATVFYTRCTERDTHSFGLEINLRARCTEWKRKKNPKYVCFIRWPV